MRIKYLLIGILTLTSLASSRLSEAAIAPITTFAPIVKQAAPAIVNIRVTKDQVLINPFLNDPAFSFFFGEGFGLPQKLRQESAGSGNIVRKDGLILTCAHVVKGGDHITVKLPDGRTYEAKILYIDERNDIALIKTTNLPKDETLPVVTIGRSEDLEVGDFLIAIGYPFGIKQTVTAGIVSAKDQQFMRHSVLQTDASVNPGNSGGALVNMKGELVAVPNAIVSRTGASHGVGFGIPSTVFRNLIKNIGDDGKIHKPWHGYDVATVESRILSHADKTQKGTGVVVRSISPGSPALKEGLRKGDIITHLGEQTIESAADFNAKLEAIDLDQKVSLTLSSSGEKKVITYIPSDLAQEKQGATQGILIEEGPLKGVKVADWEGNGGLNNNMDYEEGSPQPHSGVVVVDVSAKSPAQSFLQEGDILLSLNGIELQSVEDLKNVKYGRTLSLQIRRGNTIISLSNTVG